MPSYDVVDLLTLTFDLMMLDSGRTWRVTCWTALQSLKILRAFVLDLWRLPPLPSNRHHPMIVWKLGGKIIRTVLCCVRQLCTMIRVHVNVGSREHFLNLHVVLGLDFVFVCFFRFNILSACFCSVEGLVSSMPSQEIGWEERLLPKCPILCRVGRKTLTQSINITFAIDHHWQCVCSQCACAVSPSHNLCTEGIFFSHIWNSWSRFVYILCDFYGPTIKINPVIHQNSVLSAFCARIDHFIPALVVFVLLWV